MAFTLLLIWIWLTLFVFALGCAWRAWRYVRTPEHLRWDLYPVAHEPARAYGGSHLEHKDHWERPRKKSYFGEISFMVLEIFLLKGVWENNRKLWFGSLPFHWGLYALILATAGLTVAGIGFAPVALMKGLAVVATLGGAGTALGAAILLLIRSTDVRFRRYTSPFDKLNLALLVVLGALSAVVSVIPGGIEAAAAAVGKVIRLQPPQVSLLLGLQMAVAGLFLLYMPFTRMVHFFAKYWTYHEVRWDDREVEPGTALEKRLRAALDFGVTWSAEHLQTGKTWAEIATTIPGEKKDDGE